MSVLIRCLLIFVASFAVCLACPPPLQAQWSNSPTVNNLVRDGSLNALGARSPVSVSDGSGGMIVVWEHGIPGCDSQCVETNIYAQRVDSSGNLLWNPLGIAICASPDQQFGIDVVADGSGGAYISWQDWRDDLSSIYVQHITPEGSLLGQVNGTKVSIGFDNFDAQITSDGVGGAIVAWSSTDSDPDFFTSDILAQRVSSTCLPYWQAGGVPVASGPLDQQHCLILSDGERGANLVWVAYDYGNNPAYPITMSAQRIDSMGSRRWTPGGYRFWAVDNAGEPTPAACPDGAGGLIVTWSDWRDDVSTSSQSDIYVQHINALGEREWDANGRAVATGKDLQDRPRISSDGGGGAYVAWNATAPAGVEGTIMLQRVSWAGSLLWNENGTPAGTTAQTDEGDADVVLSPGGALVVWTDVRNGNEDLYGQLMNSSGQRSWKPEGIPICIAAGNQSGHSVVSDGKGGALIAWSDVRLHISTPDLYAQRVSLYGRLGEPEVPTLSSRPNGSINQPTFLTLRWQRDLNATAYRCQLGADSLFTTIISDTTLADTGRFIGPLSYSTTYYWRIRSMNEFGESDWSAFWRFTTIPSGTAEYPILNRWNLVSLPLTVSDTSVAAVFPTAVAGAYSFSTSSGYSQNSVMSYGKGYWVKFNESQLAPVFGTPYATQTVAVEEGWNLVGGVSSPLPVTDVISDPPDNVSSFWGYASSYTIADELEPARAYWVKAASSGTLTFQTSTHKTPGRNSSARTNIPRRLAGTLHFSDILGNQQTLYLAPTQRDQNVLELPPVPPAGAFDVRFASHRVEERFASASTERHEVIMQSVAYPLTISWKDIRFPGVRLIVGDDHFPLKEAGAMALWKPARIIVESISEESQPGAFRLHRNYPNPFNPTTTIRYNLSRRDEVTLTIHDVVGRRVAILVNETQDAGEQTTLWNASEVSSGVYYCRLRAGDFNETITMMVLK